MPDDAPSAPSRPSLAQRFRRSLSAQLLGLTILFVLLAEIVVLIPSVAKQRVSWLDARIEAAYLVGLALEAPGAEMITPSVARQLFQTANIVGVTVSRDGARIPIFSPDFDPASPPRMIYVDLDKSGPVSMIGDAWATMFSKGDDLLRVVGEPMYAAGEEVDMLVSQRALRRDLLAYARNILALSLVISTLTAMLFYGALARLIVRPVSRLTSNMATFHQNPEDAGNILELSSRQDEIGDAERVLFELETRIHGLLSQRRRLAALGAGVSKISHDLRNILASAQLMSDRLAKSDDPRVRKLSPRLIQALDRAIALSRDTLNYARMEPATLQKSKFNLRELVEEALDDNATLAVAFVNETPEGLMVVADRNQLYRAISNLVRNAVEALAPPAPDGPAPDTPAASGAVDRPRRVTVGVRRDGDALHIEIADTGPGLPPEAVASLFEPFQGSRKPGGSGLGVAIASEIMRAHGGALTLTKSDASGATFTLTLPAPA